MPEPQPHTTPSLVRLFELRKKIRDTVRAFFDNQKFLEVETPILVHSPGLEPHLDAFATTAHRPDGRTGLCYLHTSPEYAMKRLLANGVGHSYQLARVFRNAEWSHTHVPEFTLLEWYRCPGSLPDIMADTETLITAIAQTMDGPWQPRGLVRCSVSEAFTQVGLGDPLAHDDIDALRAALSVPKIEGDTWEDVFHRAFMGSVEPSFSPEKITILHGYPQKLAALAQIDPQDPRKAARFEVFVGSLELGNAFLELTDPTEQRRRFSVDLEVRRKLGRDVYPVDERFLSALGDIPPAAGIALGLDRLLMLCLGLERIQDVIPFAGDELRTHGPTHS